MSQRAPPSESLTSSRPTRVEGLFVPRQQGPAQSQGKPVYYLIPKATLQIETPLAALNGNNKAEAKKFVNWLYTPAAQTIWADNGFRPVDLTVLRKYAKQFPARPQLFKIGYVGGWDKVNKQFFDPTTGIVTKIEQSLGVSTGS